MKILGISGAVFHDASAALVIDGETVAAKGFKTASGATPASAAIAADIKDGKARPPRTWWW